MLGLGLGINKLSKKNEAAYTPAAAAYFAQLSDAIADSDKSKLNTFISGIVSDGNYDLLDRLFVANNSADNSHVSVPNPTATKRSVIGTPVFHQYTGWEGFSASALNWNFTPSTDAINFKKDDGCVFFFNVTNRNLVNAIDLGTFDGTNSIYFETINNNDLIFSINDAGGSSTTFAGFIANAIGLIGYKRINSNTIEISQNGVVVATVTLASSNLPSKSLYELAWNLNNTLFDPSTRIIFASGIGSSLVDLVKMSTRLTTLFNSWSSFPTALYSYGDSILEKFYTSSRGFAWLYQLAIQKNINQFNYGVSGMSTTTFLAAVSGGSIILPTKTRNRDRILIAFGANDYDISTVQYTNNLSTILSLFTAKGWLASDIIIVTGYNIQNNLQYTRLQYLTYVASAAAWATTNNIGQQIDFSNLSYTLNADNVHPADDAAHLVIATYASSNLTIN